MACMDSESVQMIPVKPSSPQTLGQHSVGERRRQAVLRCIGSGDVGGHYYVGPSCNSSRKGFSSVSRISAQVLVLLAMP